MGLKKYLQKRKKDKTPEPFGKFKKGKKIFVVQEHHATHLHWDFRLACQDENGFWVLKSWAIPKEPPQKPGIKRLAAQVEDHPYDYKDFEGVIPQGQYGAGRVFIWDKGRYEKIEWRNDLIEVELKGKKLKGVYILVRPKAGFNKRNWLFFKKKSEK